jgi:hypothetical protein
MELSAITDEIRQLELKLLQSDLTAHPGLIGELLAENFEEIDNCGQLHTRDDVIGWLKHKDPHICWAFKDFCVKALTDDLVLAIYSVQKPGQSGDSTPGSIRTSLWQRQGEHWKMVFHQATRKTGENL